MRDLKLIFIKLVFSWSAWTEHMCSFHVVETSISKDSVRPRTSRKFELILGVNFFSIKPFLKELSFFWVAGVLYGRPIGSQNTCVFISV